VSRDGLIYALATLTGAIGLWLMLPRGRSAGRGLGVLLAACSLVLFGWCVPMIGAGQDAGRAQMWLKQSQFLVLAGVTVASAMAAMTFRNPVYCAVWFGLTLLGTAGLMLWQGAQFLAVATIVVYAGAILVTLLFVLMLAHPTGTAPSDRLSWEAPLAATIGMVIVGVLTITLRGTLADERAMIAAAPTDAARAADVLNSEHVARLGAELFSRHLISVELAGTLLLVALVGAVAIAVHSRQPRAASATDRPAVHEPAIAGPAKTREAHHG
jgi:NADH-quinone oxidoreductase subunit J